MMRNWRRSGLLRLTLEAAVFIHPEYDTIDKRVTGYDMVNAVARINDLSTGIARLLYGGVLSKNPGAKVVAATGGAALPYALGRLMRHYDLHKDTCADPSAEFQRHVFRHYRVRAIDIGFPG